MERHIVELVDDIDRVTTHDVEIVYFTVEGTRFRTDLSQAHIKELLEALLPFMTVARREGGSTVLTERLRAVLGDRIPPRTADPRAVEARLKPGRTHTSADCRRLRDWAAEHHIRVSNARIGRDVWEAFDANNPELVDPKRRLT